MTTEQKNIQEENEIDLVEIICKLWAKRVFILKVTAVFACLGVLVALSSAKEYTAGCIIAPHFSKGGSSGNLGGLAAMAGINLGGDDGSNDLSPLLYPKILESVPFQKELMQTLIRFEEYKQPIRLIDFYTKKEYQKFSLMGTIMKYTIGLPGVIIGAIRGEQIIVKGPQNQDTLIQTLTKKESRFMKSLKGMVSIKLDDKQKYISLTAVMSEPLAAAQLALKTQILLQKYVTAFKIEKAQSELDFIEERYTETKKRYEIKQEEFAKFKDANRATSSAVAMVTEDRLSHEVNVASGVYGELVKQREQAKIKVKENTPIFTIIEPVSVPNESSKPQRGLICVAFTFLGGIIGMGLVLVLPFLAQASGHKRLSKWLPETSKE